MAVLVGAVDASEGVVGLLVGAAFQARLTDGGLLFVKALLPGDQELADPACGDLDAGVGQDGMQSWLADIAQVVQCQGQRLKVRSEGALIAGGQRCEVGLARRGGVELGAPEADVVGLEDQVLEFRCPPSEFDWYASYFGGLGGDATVLEPKELRRRIYDRASSLVEIYREKS